MEYSLISQDSFTVLGLSARIDPNHPEAIGELWERFRASSLAEEVPNRTNDDVWAVYYDYEGDHQHPYRLCVGYRVDSVGQVPESLTLVHVPASYYAMYFAQGPLPQAIVDTWQHVWETPLARRYRADFEVYGRFAQDPSDAEVPVFVGIESPDA